jgi:LysR family cys regulon transcriptional activator
MTLAQLRYLLAIIDSNLNITLAAERAHATQPGISKQLRLLEEELGFQIFVRRGKSLDRLSPAGAQVIERARRILDEAASIRNLAANHRGESQGELVIATTQTQARFVLPPALKALKARYPDVTVRLNLFADAEQARTAGRDADLLIASHVEAPDAAENAIPLYSWRRVALFPDDHPLAAIERPLTPVDLAAFPLIGYESALGTHASVAAAFAAAGVETRFAYAAHDTEVIKAYVRSGLGVGLLAEMALVEEGDLLHRPVEGLPVCAAYASLQAGRVPRDYTIDLVSVLAPQSPRRAIARRLSSIDSGAVKAPLEWSQWRRAVDQLVLDGAAQEVAGVAPARYATA